MTASEDDAGPNSPYPTRRAVVAGGVAVPIAMSLSSDATAQSAPSDGTPPAISVNLTVNGTRHALTLDARSTLLSAHRV